LVTLGVVDQGATIAGAILGIIYGVATIGVFVVIVLPKMMAGAGARAGAAAAGLQAARPALRPRAQRMFWPWRPGRPAMRWSPYRPRPGQRPFMRRRFPAANRPNQVSL